MSVSMVIWPAYVPAAIRTVPPSGAALMAACTLLNGQPCAHTVHVTHWPPSQPLPAPQSLSQALQFWGSLVRSTHAPPQQTSLACPPQDVPSGAVGLEQVPVCGSQSPATWHWSLAVQTTGLPPVQTPA